MNKDKNINKEIKNALIDVYLDIHVSELRKYPEAVTIVWNIGQELYSARLRRKNIKS